MKCSPFLLIYLIDKSKVCEFLTQFHNDKYQLDEDTDDTGTSYAVIWKCKEDCGEQSFKIKLTVYQMDFLQVITVLMLNDKTCTKKKFIS